MESQPAATNERLLGLPTERHLLLANHCPANRAASRLTLSGAVGEVDLRTRGRVPVELGGTREGRFTLEPGIAKLYLLDTG